MPPPTVKRFTLSNWDDHINWPQPLVGAVCVAVATGFLQQSTVISTNILEILRCLCDNCLKFQLDRTSNVLDLTSETIKSAVAKIIGSKNETIEYLRNTINDSPKAEAIKIFNLQVFPGGGFRLNEKGRVTNRQGTEVAYLTDLGNHFYGLVCSAETVRKAEGK
ncbi:hypothetical protein MMC14_001626 [Varicellaria rhodocarpa]|nr:hypothetical protein [Varicellaria rhodocarpa]